MKNIFLLAVIILALFTSCNKNADTIIPNVITPESINPEVNQSLNYSISNKIKEITHNTIDKKLARKAVKTGSIFTSIDKILVENHDFFNNQTIDNRDFGCLDITFENPFWEVPNTITYDFGESCILPNGKEVSGKIITYYTGLLIFEGNYRTTTFENFVYNGIAIGGIITKTHLETAGDFDFQCSREVNGGSIVYPDGSSVAYEEYHNYTYLGGEEFFNNEDDNIIISGFSESTICEDDECINYICHINENLIIPGSCDCIAEGSIEYTTDNQSVFILDFGDGECDGIAIMNYADGTSEEIIICE